jgi:hypothetical protein
LDNFKFSVGPNDILLTLTLNNNLVEDSLNTLIGKMIIIKEVSDVILSDLSVGLDFMQIDKLNIISISDYPTHKHNLDKFNFTIINEPSVVKYAEIDVEDFIIFLNNPDLNFSEYNKNTLYIIRNGSFLDLKSLFNKINDCSINISRGSSQKSHMISPLDFRLYSYLMAMFKFNFKLVTQLNTFNSICKSRYLPYNSIYKKHRISVINNKLEIKYHISSNSKY